MSSKRGIEAGKAFVTAYMDDTRLKRGLTKIRGMFAKVGASLGRIGIGSIAAMAGSFAAVLAPIRKAAEMEQVQTAFSTLLGGADKAKAALSDLKDFAAKTPFEFPELADAARSLIAFGIEQKDLIPTLRAVGDVASAVGAPIGEIAEIYGKARVQGRLFAEDINQLTGRGIPIIQELAKQFGVAETQVKGLVEKGSVNFSNLEAAFVSLTSKGGKFFGMMDQQSQTVAGRWSTLKDRFNELLTGIGEKMLPAVTAGMDAIERLGDFWSDTCQRMGLDWGSFVRSLASGFAQWDAWISDAQASNAEFWAWMDEWRLGGRVETEIGKGLRAQAEMHRQKAQRFAEEAGLIAMAPGAPKPQRPEIKVDKTEVVYMPGAVRGAEWGMGAGVQDQPGAVQGADWGMAAKRAADTARNAINTAALIGSQNAQHAILQAMNGTRGKDTTTAVEEQTKVTREILKEQRETRRHGIILAEAKTR